MNWNEPYQLPLLQWSVQEASSSRKALSAVDTSIVKEIDFKICQEECGAYDDEEQTLVLLRNVYDLFDITKSKQLVHDEERTTENAQDEVCIQESEVGRQDESY